MKSIEKFENYFSKTNLLICLWIRLVGHLSRCNNSFMNKILKLKNQRGLSKLG